MSEQVQVPDTAALGFGAKAGDMPWVVRHTTWAVSLAVAVVASVLLILRRERLDAPLLALSIGGGLVLVATWSAGVNYLAGVADGRFAEQYDQAHRQERRAGVDGG